MAIAAFPSVIAWHPNRALWTITCFRLTMVTRYNRINFQFRTTSHSTSNIEWNLANGAIIKWIFFSVLTFVCLIQWMFGVRIGASCVSVGSLKRKPSFVGYLFAETKNKTRITTTLIHKEIINLSKNAYVIRVQWSMLQIFRCFVFFFLIIFKFQINEGNIIKKLRREKKETNVMHV